MTAIKYAPIKIATIQLAEGADDMGERGCREHAEREHEVEHELGLMLQLTSVPDLSGWARFNFSGSQD